MIEGEQHMFIHESVLQQEAIDHLNIKSNGTYVDCTVGGGGHAVEIVKKLDKDGRLIAFDQDLEALQAAKQRLHRDLDRILFVHDNFRHLERCLAEHQINSVNGVLFDLGVSSPQLDNEERGFSYRFNAPLDMRMNQTQSLSAYDVVNEWSYEQLVSIFFRYGEEKFSKQIARKIESSRNNKSIETTFELVEIIKEAIPAPARRTGGHPARRVFQAIRIAVNDELQAFREALEQAARLLSVKGRLCVITFHSLEDRICKQAFAAWSRPKPIPKNLPVLPEDDAPPFRLVHRKPIIPSEQELLHNRRSRSAKLRVLEKTRPIDDAFTFEEGWK